ncbi:MAG: YifB family Mg chelatase-like AAA ATPase [Patescibacteria group bacterium]
MPKFIVFGMLAKLFSGTIIGLAGMLIEVEVDVANRGFPTFAIVGLPNKAIDEAKDRVRTALVNAGYEMPDSRITVNLAPADIPKMGSGFDLPIALGILAASRSLMTDFFQNSLFIGELSLHGDLRGVPGVISIALMAKEKKIKNIFLPKENAAEASAITDIEVFPVEHVSQLVNHLHNKAHIQRYIPAAAPAEELQNYEFDFSEVKGQEEVKRALTIAAAGFHNIYIKGSPGSGKTMLCRAFPSILPPLNQKEILEVSKIYSAVNMKRAILTTERPFRSPHHTTSRIGLIGGGAVPIPGEISLAHKGVLFLDEFAEFSRSTLEALRQPMEDGTIAISRASGSFQFPARFLLLAASNPCQCGYLGHPRKTCKCSMAAIFAYRKKLSGPLLDRIELCLNVLPVEEEKLSTDFSTETSKEIRQRVLMAVEKQRKRFKESDVDYNSQMKSSDIETFCTFSSAATAALKQAISRLNLSARSYFKIKKVAQTIADLTDKAVVDEDCVNEAIQYRMREL